MVHLLVLAVVAASDDRFLLTTFTSFAFGGKEDICIVKGVSASASSTQQSHFRGGVIGRGKKRSSMEEQKESGSRFFQITMGYHFTQGVLVGIFLLGRQTKA